MRMRESRLLLALSFLILLGGFQGKPGTVFAATPKGVLKATTHWAPSADWFDPSLPGFAQSSLFNLYLFHDALMKPMPDGLHTPCLAESWNISSHYRVYEFKLRKGVKFHNGDEMTAEDVVFTFWRYKGGSFKFIQEKTEKVEAVNPYLVRITFKTPFPDFFDHFITGESTIGWILPKKYIEKVGDAEFRRHPIGCGPYRLLEFTPGVRMVGEAFEGFWRKVPDIKRMEFYFVKEDATRYAMVKRGEVDMATLMIGVFYESVKKDPGLRLLNPESPTRHIVCMTAQWDPKSPWADPRVRKAASLAIDRKTLADVHTPGCVPYGSIGLPDEPEGSNFPPDPYDPARARKLLVEAGYPHGFHGGTFYPWDGPYWPQSEQVANYWKAIGITFDSVLLDRVAFVAKRRGGQMKGATFIEAIAHPTIGMRLEYLFGGGFSYGNYPDIQALWEQYRKASDPKIRKGLIGQVQKLIYDRTVFIPLTTHNSPAALGPKIKGNPYRIQKPYPIWFMSPMEDIELQE